MRCKSVEKELPGPQPMYLMSNQEPLSVIGRVLGANRACRCLKPWIMLVLHSSSRILVINLSFEEDNVNPEIQKDFVSHLDLLLHPCNIFHIPELHSSIFGLIPQRLRAQDEIIQRFIIVIVTNHLFILRWSLSLIFRLSYFCLQKQHGNSRLPLWWESPLHPLAQLLYPFCSSF